MHRYNAALPDVYRGVIPSEAELFIRALTTLACSDWLAEDDGAQSVWEGYGLPEERALAALEKGVHKCLDLKYPLMADDYSLLVLTLLRGCLSPSIEIGLRSKLARASARLMSKKDCTISGGVPWRLIVNSILEEHVECMHGAQFIGNEVRDNHCKNLVHLLSKCVFYLPGNDTAHSVWGAFIEKIRQFDSDSDTAYLALVLLSHILPTKGVEWTGWTTEGIQLLTSVDESPFWDALWASMFARVAKHQPNIVDWTPCIPVLFKHMCLTLGLPLGAAAPHSPLKLYCPRHCYFLLNADLVDSFALFTVYALSPRQPSARAYLERFIVLIENFCHPSNSGNWSASIGCVLLGITQALVARVSAERRATKSGIHSRISSDAFVHAVAPHEHRLNDIYVDSLVSLLLPLINLGLYSKSSSMSKVSASAARDLAVLSPLLVAPLLDVGTEGLTYMASPHRTSTALKLLTSLTPVFLDSSFLPNGSELLLRALELTLPGIDPNDPSKTISTMRFIAGATARFYSVQETGGFPEFSAFLENYVPSLLTRIFLLCSAADAPEKKSRQQVLHSLLATAMENLFSALPPILVVSAAKRIAREVAGSAKTNAMKYYGLLVRISASAAARVLCNGKNPSPDIFLPPLLGQLLDKRRDQVVLTALSEEELVWRVRMVAQACRCVGTGIEGFVPDLCSLVRLSIRKPERKIYKAGGRALRGLLEGLTSIQSVVAKNRYNMEIPNKMCWWIPTPENWALAREVLNQFLSLAEAMVLEYTNGTGLHTVGMKRESLFRVLRLLHAIQRGARWICGGVLSNEFKSVSKFEAREDLPISKSEAMLLLRRPVRAGLGGELDPDGSTCLWNRTYGLILNVISTAIVERPNDSALLYRCLEPIELAGEPFKETSIGKRANDALYLFKNSYKSVVEMKRPHGEHGGVGRRMPSFVFQFRVLLQQEYRMAYAARPGSNNHSILEAFAKLLVQYAMSYSPRVRGKARGVLTRTLRIMHAGNRNVAIRQLMDMLTLSLETISAKNGTVLLDLPAAPRRSELDMDSGSSSFAERNMASCPDSCPPESRDVFFHDMIGLASILRSSACLAIVIRDFSLHVKITRIMVEMISVADRPDAIASANAMYKRVMSSFRCLPLHRPLLLDMNFSLNDHPPAESQYVISEAEKACNDISSYLLGRLQNPPCIEVVGEITNNARKETHWRVQSLVASILYVNIRADRPPSFDVATFFGTGLISDIVSVRLISSKAILLILALHGMKPKPKLEPLPCTFVSSRRSTCVPNDATRALDELLGRTGYMRNVIHTLALDHENYEHGEMRKNQTWVAGGYNALISFTSRYDSTSTWIACGGQNWPKSKVPRSHDALCLSRVRLYEYFLRTFGMKAFFALNGPLLELVTLIGKESKGMIKGVRDEEVCVIVGEVLCALCRGSFLSIFDRAHEITAKTASWVICVLESFKGPQGAVNGGTMIRLITSADPGSLGVTVAENLVDWLLSGPRLLSNPGSQAVASRFQARKLRFLQCAVSDETSQNMRHIARCVRHASSELFSEAAFAHELQAVRQEVGRFIALAVWYSDLDPSFSAHVDSAVQLLVSSREQSGVDVADDTHPFISNDCDDKRKETVAKKMRSRLGETLSNVVSLVYWAGLSRKFHPFLGQLLPSLFVSLDDSDTARVSQCRLALSLVAQGHYSDAELLQIIPKVEEAANSPRWRIRGGVLPFTQVLAFCSQFTAAPRYITRMREIILKLISDKQIEVRTAAGATIVPLIRDAPPAAVEEIRRRFMDDVTSTQPLRQPKSENRIPPTPDMTRKRHGAVLGLSALVQSSPYAVPKWMPSVLVALSVCINDPPPVSTSVRTLFSDFMRTHRDEWSRHKNEFTCEELEIVSDLLISPSYYA